MNETFVCQETKSGLPSQNKENQRVWRHKQKTLGLPLYPLLVEQTVVCTSVPK